MHESTEPPAAAAPLSRGNFLTVTASPAGTQPADIEQFEELLSGDAFRLERIVSTGQVTPPGEWYDQPDDEWVMLLSGSATLRFEDRGENGLGETIDLVPGDWLLIPAHCRHRVERTSADGPSVWLALHARRR